MRRSYAGLIALLEGCSALLLLGMVALVLVGVFFRYIVGAALSWYDEFAGYLLVWLSLYGSVVALARGKHIGFETVKERLSPEAQRWVDVFGALCVLGFSLVLLVSSWVLIRAMAAETAVSIPEVRMAWVYSVLPVSGGLMVLVSLVHLGGALAGREPDGGRRFKGLEEAQ